MLARNGTKPKNRRLTKDEKILKKVENYVDQKREQTSTEIMERKSKRPTTKYQKGDLEVMISRISEDSKPKESTKKTSKLIMWIIYAFIIFVILMMCAKIFF